MACLRTFVLVKRESSTSEKNGASVPLCYEHAFYDKGVPGI